jgi:hypothetical protein
MFRYMVKINLTVLLFMFSSYLIKNHSVIVSVTFSAFGSVLHVVGCSDLLLPVTTPLSS